MRCVADFNVSLPSFRNGATTEEKVEELLRYSQKVHEQLRYVLNNLDVDNFSPESSEKLSGAISLTDAATGADAKINALSREIKKNASLISESFSELTESLALQRKWVSDNYILTEQADSKFALSGQGVTIESVYGKIIETINGVFGDSDPGAACREDYSGLIRAGLITNGTSTESGIVISSSSREGSFETVYTASKLEFRQGGNVLAYFSNDDLYIPIIRTWALKFFSENEGEGFQLMRSADGKTLTLRFSGEAISINEVNG